MQVYRISICDTIEIFDGRGAAKYGGRWNSKHNPVIYTSESIALAALENVVHIPNWILSKNRCLAVISIPDSLKITIIKKKDLGKNWRQYPAPVHIQELGDNWLFDNKTPILKVPSVISERENNYLINPNHPDFKKIKISEVIPYPFDVRLFGSKKK